jgi:hypothetical protein
MTILKKLPGLFAGLALLYTSGAALAGQPLVVHQDHSKILTVSRTPGTVVVGNPSIVDVTIEGNKLFLHGRAFGSSNVVVLDDSGNLLSEYDVTVMAGGNNNVFVFKAGSSYGYVCAPDCEATLHIGDPSGWFVDEIAKEQKIRNSIALDLKEGEAKEDGGQQPAQ